MLKFNSNSNLKATNNMSLQCDNYTKLFEMVNCSFSMQTPTPETQIKINYGDNVWGQCKDLLNFL